MRKILSLLMATLFSVVLWGQAPVGTTLFSENFGGYAANDVPSGSVSSLEGSRVVYGSGSVTYTSADNGKNLTKIYAEALASGTSPELLVGKSGGVFTVAGIPSGNAKEITVSFKQNAQKLTVSLAGTGYSTEYASPKPAAAGEVTFDITVADGADATFSIIMTAGSSNVRVDDILVTVKTAGESSGGDDPQPTTQDLYLKLSSDWAGWPAKYAVYYFNDTENGWSEFMTEVDGEDNTYTTTIPVGYSKVIFVRLDGAATEANWDNKWSQTGNQDIPEGKNHFTVTSGGTGSECGGVWTKYPVVPTYYVAGTMTSWADNMVEMNEGSYTFEGLAAGKYEIKVVDNNSNWLGFDKLNTTASNKNVYGEGTGNIKFVLGEEGDVTVAYDGAKITVTGATIVAPTTVFTVTVPEGTEKAFIAGNFTKWEPVEMTLKEEGVFTYTFAGDAADSASYKYLAGPDWKYVEVNADDSEADNRGYAAADEVAKWKAVPVALKYAKVTKAPINWTGHYIISFGDSKPHMTISADGKDLIAAADAPAFVDGDTISMAEGFDVEIRFSETAGAYTIKLPSEKYIKIPGSNAVNEDATAMALYLNYFKGTKQEGVQIADKNDFTSTGTRMIYKNNNNYRSYTDKINNASYILPTLYRLVDEAFDCQDGPYGVLINGKDVVVAEALAGEEEYDAAGRKQYRAYLNLGKEDIIQIVNTSCGSAWLPAIEEGGMSAHFDADDEMAVIDTTGCFDLYIKMKEGDDKLYIGAGICADDTIRYTVRGKGGILGEDFEKAIDSKQDTLELALEAGKYELKVVVGEDWKGFEQLTDTAAGLTVGDQGNICFTLKEDGNVTIVYNESVFKLIGNFYVKPVVKKDLQFVPGVWAEEGAKIAAWIWGAELESQWTAFFAPKAAENDTLQVEINADADSIIFVRFKPEATVPTWEGGEGYIWNRLADDSIQYESLIYTITGWGEGQGEGTWDVYVPEVPAKYYITGIGGWDEKQVKSEADVYVFEGLKADTVYTFKVLPEGLWEGGTILGYDELSEKPAGVYADNDRNVCFKLAEAGDVTITYKAAAEEEAMVFTVEGNFYVKPVVKKDLQFVPGVWAEEGAKIAAWIWGAELESQWTAFFAPKAAENDTLQVEINADADSIIFVRFKPEATVPTWEGGEGYIWNRLADDSIQYESLIYTITGWGEGQGEGTWDVYVPEVPAKYYITGIGGWAEKQVKSEADVYVFEGLKADTVYTFKVLPEGLWEGGTILGYDELSEKPAGVYADNNKNVCFKLAEAGDVTITYKAAAEEEPMVFTVEGNFYVKPVVKKDLQFVPGVWAEEGAKIAAWIWGAELESQWTAFFAPKAAENDTLQVEINADADSIIFVRFKPEATEPKWDGGEGYIWNRLADDSIQYESLIYTITGWGEGQGEGTWDVYVPEVPAKYYITGDAALVGEDLAWNPAAIASMEDEYEMTLAAGAYKMKITVDGKWETAKGVEQLTTRAAGVQNLNGNIGFILAEETTVKVTYTGEVFTLEGNFVQTPIIKTYMATGAGWTGDDESSAVYDAENQVVTINLVQSKQAQWQAQVWYQGPEVKADKYYDVSFKMQSNHAVNGVIAKYQESNEMFFDNTIALEENVELTYSKTNLEGKVGNNVLAFDFGFAPAGTVITISEIAIVEKDAPEYTLTDGYYLIGRGGWDISALTPDLKLTLNPDAEGGVEEYTIEANLVAGDKFQIVKVENDAIGSWFPGGEDNNYLVDADHAGAKTIYFRPNYNGGDDWHHNCIFVPANEPIVYCELPSGHLGQADFGDPSGRILLTIAKGEGNNLVVKIKNNNEAGNPQTGLNFLWVNATGATNNNATYGSHEAENVEEVSVIVEFDEAKETYHFNNIHWAYAGWTGEWAIDGLDVAASELCEEEEPIEYRLENGFYLISEAENWDVANVTAAMKFEANPDNEAEFVLTATFAEGDKIKVVKVENDVIVGWYPDGEGTEYTVDAAHAGEKDIYFQEAYKADWSEFGGYFWMGANPIEYRLENGFYLISEAENWDVANVTAAMKFEANPDNEAEFVLTATFAEGDKIKVVKVVNDAIAQWYPDGEGTEYTVDANHAGANKDIYFQEEYKADWATFGGYFWIGANDASAILNAEVENVAVKLLQNGQVIIRRGERVYTIMGQLIK